MVNIQVKSSMPAFYIGKKKRKKTTNSVLAPMETENQHRGNRFLALLKSCKRSASKNSSFTHTTKRFSVFSVCVGALFPGQRNNSAWLTRAALGMLIQFECSHMARGGQTRAVTLLS